MQRKEYELSDADYKRLILAIHDARNTPVMMIGGTTPRSVQEAANDAWSLIGREMGLDGASVEPAPGKGERFFTAIPVKPKIAGRGRLNLVFDGPPGPEGARFIESEDAYGASVNCGRWLQEGDRYILIID